MAKRTNKQYFGETKTTTKRGRGRRTNTNTRNMATRRVTRARNTTSNDDTVTITIPKEMAFGLGVLIGQARAQ